VAVAKQAAITAPPMALKNVIDISLIDVSLAIFADA
jgi:hypothetical protein